MSSSSKQIITRHIANFSRSKDNQARKFDQLLEYNLRIIFP